MRLSGPLSIRQAAIVQFISRYSSVVVQLVVSMVLARLVTPEEYGIVAIVTVFTNFVAVLSDLGLSAGVVQHKELDDRDLSGLFLFTLGIAVLLALVFSILSIPASMVYGGSGDGSYSSLIRSLFLVASIGVFFSTLNTLPNGILLRKKDFFAIGVRLVVINILSGCVAIVMACCGFGCYALVVQFVFSSAVTFVCGFVLSGLRIQNAPVLAPLRSIFGYSAFQLAHGFINYFSLNLDNLLVGAFFGSAALGYYDKAYKLAGYPVAGFTSIVSSVLHPYLSEYQDQPSMIYDRFLAITQGVFAVGILITSCCVAAPREIVDLLFGGQWEESVPLFCALAVCVMFRMIISLTGAVFQSLGATRDMFLSAVVNTSITAAAICLGVWLRDLRALAMLVTAAYCINPVATYYFLVVRAFRFSLRPFVRALFPQLVVACIMLAVGACGQWAFNTLGVFRYTSADLLAMWFAPLPSLLLKSAVCIAVYGVVLVATGQLRHMGVFWGGLRGE